MKISRQFNSIRITTGGVLMGVGTGIASLLPAILVVGGALFVVGSAITLLGFFHLSPVSVSFYDKWNSEEILKVIEEASPNSTVRILQTWFPDTETFIPALENLLVKGGKHFQLRILLMDSDEPSDDKPDVLHARIRHRTEERHEAAANITATINALMMMKSRVDSAWLKQRDGATLDLKIRRYCFLPFGPIYQIGSVMFAGFYLNHCSSAVAPMLKLSAKVSRCWTPFQQHLETAWKDAQPMEM